MRRSLGVLVTIALAACTSGCAGGARTRTRPAADLATDPAPGLRIVLFSESHAVGVESSTGEELWRRPVRAFGPPASTGGRVVVPVYGNRLVSLDAKTGRTLWERELPGEALTGLSASERWVLVAALQRGSSLRARRARGARSRSLVAGLSLRDGRVRWRRESDEQVGAPAAVGTTGFVPVGDRVLALALATGRTVGHLKARPGTRVDRIDRHGGAVLAFDGNTLIELGASVRVASELDAEGLLTRVGGIEPGLGHQGGIVFRLLPTASGVASRNALFLSRRVLMFIRFDEHGRPSVPRWVHMRFDQQEYIDFHPTRSSVVLVREDGALVELDRETGRPRRERAGVVAPDGVVFVGDPSVGNDRSDVVDRSHTLGILLGLLEDPDPRLLPAQRLTLKLLWRAEHPQTRAPVREMATGAFHAGTSSHAVALATYAQSLVRGPWGRGNSASVQRLAARLRSGKLRGADLQAATREAVIAGGPAVVEPLVSLLSHPSLSPREIHHVAAAVQDLGRAADLGQ